MLYRTKNEVAIGKLIEEFSDGSMGSYEGLSVMVNFKCPKCGISIDLVEAAGSHWDVCRSKDKSFFSEEIRLLTNDKMGERLIIDITLCDCGHPIYARTKNENYDNEGNEILEPIQSRDFLPEEHVCIGDEERITDIGIERWMKQQREFLTDLKNS